MVKKIAKDKKKNSKTNAAKLAKKTNPTWPMFINEYPGIKLLNIVEE